MERYELAKERIAQNTGRENGQKNRTAIFLQKKQCFYSR